MKPLGQIFQTSHQVSVIHVQNALKRPNLIGGSVFNRQVHIFSGGDLTPCSVNLVPSLTMTAKKSAGLTLSAAFFTSILDYPCHQAQNISGISDVSERGGI